MSKDTTSGKTACGRTSKRDTIKIKIKGSWTAIPNKLLKDRRLSRDARLLACLIFMHAANAGRAFPSQEELAEELGQSVEQEDGTIQERTVTVRSIQRWLKELKQAGWIEWRKTLLNNEYTLLDPAESSSVSTPAEADSSLNEALTDQPGQVFEATQESPSNTTQGSRSTALEGSAGATLAGPSNTTQESPPPSGSASAAAPAPVTQPAAAQPAPPDHTPTSLYLAERGINAALEFRDMPLPLIEEIWHRIMGRNPDTDLSVVVRALRAVRARQAQTAPTATYAERQAAAARRARQIAPSDATDEEIEWLILDMAEGGMSEAAACTRLEERRAFRDHWAARE
jgi:hypothetical protein